MSAVAAPEALSPPAGGVADSLLDAVSELLADRTWAQVRMVDVAQRSGISRQSIYNTFGTREGLASAYVMRETTGFLEIVEDAIAAGPEDPLGALTSALELFLAAAETHPLVRAISASEDGDELLALVTTRGGPVLAHLTTRLAALIAATWPVDERRSELAADTLVRLAISHAALPAGSPAETAGRIAEILTPFVEWALGAGANPPSPNVPQ